MPKVTGPLFSLAASGTFRGELEFRNQGTRTIVAGARAISPPRSAAQDQQAMRFKTAVDAWNGLDEPTKAAWRSAATTTNWTGYQFFLSEYQTQNCSPPDLPVIP